MMNIFNSRKTSIIKILMNKKMNMLTIKKYNKKNIKKNNINNKTE